VLDASAPANDKIFDPAAFEKFLHDRIKVDNRTGNLGDSIAISREGGKVVVVANGAKFSGRYLKYLTKKFLKKQNVMALVDVLLFNGGRPLSTFPFGELTLWAVARLAESYFYVQGCL